ncbi:MAG: cytochrome P450, partial [Proteobacteria bacterium]|nr:cytochrome P450 [Pseudomonadota bacterium]
MSAVLQEPAWRRRLADLPCPRGLPWVGNLFQIDSMQFHATLEQWARELGPTYRFQAGPRHLMVVSDPAIIGTLLRDRPDAMRRTFRSARAFEELGTTGVFNAEGEDWKRQRRLVMRALTPEVIRNFFPTLVALNERLLRRWQAAVAAGRPVNLLRDLKAWTLDVTIALAMGQDINTLEHDANPLQGDIERIFNRVARRLTSPVSYWRYFRLPVDRAADAASARIQQAVTGFVAETRKRIEANPALRAKPTNLLEAFVVARDEPGSEFTDAHVIGNAVTMVFAGEDTTSNTIAWLMNFVARDANVAARIAAEAHAVLGADPVLQSFGALDSFAYLDACIDEAMRIKPVAPFLGLETNRQVVVGDVLLEPRTPVLVITRHAGMDAADFPDPEAFLPERWLGDKRPAADDPARKLFPFGGGPRFCPGRYLALAEIKMVMSMAARNFSLVLDQDAPPVQELF